MKIQFVDLHRQYLAYKDDVDAQINDVIANSSFITGAKVAELEKMLADFTQTKYAIGCSSGTDALLLALMAYNIEPDDEIITTPFSFIATSEVISFLKAKPVFVDIDPATFNIDTQQIEGAITAKTRGILAVDIFGQCADYDEINAIAKKNNLFVIEDSAQSFGAQYKGQPACSLTNIACTSFFPAKPLGCFGDGGMVFTNDENIYNTIQSLCHHGKGSSKSDIVRIGLNARLDTIQAAVLIAKFQHYSKEIIKRNDVAQYYDQNLKEIVETPKILKHNLSVFAQYCMLIEDRDALQKSLKENNIPTAIHYPKPLHVQPALSYLGYNDGSFPIAEETCRNILALPMHAHLNKDEQDYIIESIKSFYKR